MSDDSSEQKQIVNVAIGDDDLVTLPAGVCEALGLEPGDEVEVNWESMTIRLTPSGPESVRGILGGLFPDWDAAERFLSEERTQWPDA